MGWEFPLGTLNLKGSNLEGVDLSNSTISRADLRGANLLEAKLPDYDTSSYRLPKLEGAIMPDGTFYREDK